MKITKSQLKQIIKEEIQPVLAEAKNLPTKVHAKAAKIRGEKGNKNMSREQSYAIAANMMKEQVEEDKYEEIYSLATQAEQFALAVQDEELKTTLVDFFSRIATAALHGQEGTS